jgi:sugar lactone lactonase YvrE
MAAGSCSSTGTSTGVQAAAKTEQGPYAKPGFVTIESEGRLWVFREGAKELEQYRQQGELAKHVVRPAAGPDGKTLKAPDTETLDAYMACKPGFATRWVEGRLWVFREGSKELQQFEKDGELAKHVVRPAAGPGRVTIKAPDSETIDAYVTTKTGFVTKIVEGRLWVFREGAKELPQFERDGELAKHVIRPAAGPGKMTIRAPDTETIDAYLSAR